MEEKHMAQTWQPIYLLWQGSKFLKIITKKHMEHIQLPQYPVWDNEKLYFRNPAFMVYLCPDTLFLKLQCIDWKTDILNGMNSTLAIHYISILR